MPHTPVSQAQSRPCLGHMDAQHHLGYPDTSEVNDYGRALPGRQEQGGGRPHMVMRTRNAKIIVSCASCAHWRIPCGSARKGADLTTPLLAPQ